MNRYKISGLGEADILRAIRHFHRQVGGKREGD